MKERPILFSPPMVQAILAGRKTQTRRIIKPQPKGWNPSGLVTDGNDTYKTGMCYWCLHGDQDYSEERKSPYGVSGDRLWVRETWAEHPEGRILYRATDLYEEPLRWRPSIFMPHSASRITLAITGVRIERLQEISEKDARKEGVTLLISPARLQTEPYRNEFRMVWDEINGKTWPWGSNPWVWVIEFKII